jgi:cytochrome oxidase Cu insertion factor (SCO1/SenC/PrrC family)
MKTQSKLVSGIFLVILFVVLPGMSYFYLQTGLNYHRARKAELDSLGYVKNLEFADQLGGTFKTSDMKGKMSVIGFFSPNCGASCDTLTKRFQLIQKEFSNYDKLLLLSFNTNPQNDSISVLNDHASKAKAQEGMWYWLTVKENTSAYHAFINSFDAKIKDGAANKLVLVDTNLLIRRYYDVNDINEINRLIIHLGKFAPRPPDQGIQFKREKEK